MNAMANVAADRMAHNSQAMFERGAGLKLWENYSAKGSAVFDIEGGSKVAAKAIFKDNMGGREVDSLMQEH